jgi:hypothetical protein
MGDPAGRSLSRAITTTFCDVKPDAEHVIVAPLSTVSASSAAETVTVCGVFQFEGVNVSDDGDAVTADVPDERATDTVRFDDGATASFAVNVPLEASFTDIEVVETMMFCVPVPTQVRRMMLPPLLA